MLTSEFELPVKKSHLLRPAKIIGCIDLEMQNVWMPDSLRRQFPEVVGCIEWIHPTSSPLWLETLRELKPEVLLTSWGMPPLTENLMEKLPELRYICHVNGTIRSFLPRALISQGLLVTNWGNIVTDQVAECSLMMILCALRQAGQLNSLMHEVPDGWHPGALYTQTLFGKRVGLHGFGRIARKLAKLLEAFNVSIKCYSDGVSGDSIKEHGLEAAADLAELFQKSDIVVELESLTPKTRHSVKEEHLRLLRQGGVFVNIGRGAVVDEAALVRVAQQGRIQIALDVYENEPLPASSALRKLSNVFLLPHIGGPTQDCYEDCGRFALENLHRYLCNEPLLSLIDERIYDMAT